MRRILLVIALCNAAASPHVVRGETPRDEQLLSAKTRASLAPYESLDDFGRGYFSRDLYERARGQQEFDVLDIRYASDDLEVPGVLVRPKNAGGRKWPAIIYNRGGTGDYGKINDLTVVDLYLLAKAGFVVIASDYRFHDATAKRDEWGGADLNDIINLIPALRSLDIVDRDHFYMLGVSRGGTMTYLALMKRHVPIRAAAVIAGPSDLEALGRHQPAFVNGDETYDGWAKVWPDYDHHAPDLYRDRSPIFWAESLDVPILILHSRQDRLVPVEHALRMAAALQASGKPYALHIYERDGHSLPLNRDDRNRQIVDWFLSAR